MRHIFIKKKRNMTKSSSCSVCIASGKSRRKVPTAFLFFCFRQFTRGQYRHTQSSASGFSRLAERVGSLAGEGMRSSPGSPMSA